MANYKLVLKKSVSKDIRPIPTQDVALLLRCIQALQENPHPVGSEKLSGQERYRIRQGVYRIIYEVADELLVVTVVKFGHRKQVYKRREGGRQMGRLTAITREKQPVRYGILKDSIRLHVDFDESLPDEVLAGFEGR